MLKASTQEWTVADSTETYGVANWSLDYFSVGDNGNLFVHPTGDLETKGDLSELIRRLTDRGIRMPVLLRFNEILEHRLTTLNDAFAAAIEDHDYLGQYCCVYPIKVNQQRQVVEHIHRSGRQFGFGLEAGSKPELLAVVALADNDTPIMCNGFKDSQFIEMVMLARKMGRNAIPVVEKATELDLILEQAQRCGVRPQIGMRVKLAACGAGRWQSSGGHKSKFGLSVSEILELLKRLNSLEMGDCFKLLHFHPGSQVTDIRQIKTALNEAARIYAELLKRGAGLEYLNVGGGLGVDYNGTQTSTDSSMNYSLQEYANDVVFHVSTVCDSLGVPHPTIVSESGRAIAAYHSVLLFEVLGTSAASAEAGDIEADSLVPEADTSGDAAESNGAKATANEQQPLPVPLVGMQYTLSHIHEDNLMESYHDAQQAFEMAISGFATGSINLEHRGLAEKLYWRICRRIHELAKQQEYVPEELSQLDTLLAETYFCNFSLFQSMPDSWAIDQLFPVMPIHRLNERPTQNAVLGDITCDSDGQINRFVNLHETQPSLPVHKLNGQPYYLAAFLIGAYQEILGDLHNLFGDTDAVHLTMNGKNPDGSNRFLIEQIIKGDSVSEVLGYVQFNPEELLAKMHSSVESAVNCDSLNEAEAGKLLDLYEEGLRGYTYLNQGRERS